MENNYDNDSKIITARIKKQYDKDSNTNMPKIQELIP